ncbi:MAG: protein translocase subunit SecD [bacterium]
MMNRYPLWKYLIIMVVVLVSSLYALPNLFPSQPAVQITAVDDAPLDQALLDSIQQTLTQQNFQPKAIEQDAEKFLIRFDSTDTQLAAADAIKAFLLQQGLAKRYSTALNLVPATPQWLRALNAQPMYLGLDLRGGVHFLMEVDSEAVVNKNLNPYVRDIKDAFRNEKIAYASVVRKGEQISVMLKSPEDMTKATDLLKQNYRQQLDIKVESQGSAISLQLNQETLTQIKRFAVKQNIMTLRKRVNELGVAEPIIQQQGLDRIVVQLPGVQDSARAKDILGATATLEFRLVDEKNNAVQAQNTGRIPVGSKLYQERNGSPILLKRRVMLEGDRITDAQAGYDETQQPSVTIVLDGKGAKQFSRVTGQHIQDLMAVVFIETRIETKIVDGQTVKEKVTTEEVINVARIQDQLSKRFQITGLDSPKESSNLALLLRAGALAAPVYIVEESTVGPSLGQQNIDNGFTSVVIGFLLVLIFMAVYYKVFGLVANVALALNLVLIIAALSIMQATLTLPGIAGIVLTVGMAVDANVLIFERIREELKNGLSPQAAINAGYEKALSTIADANITTLIAAIVLFAFGTGPIKGFAITLAIGIVSSMFTAIMVTRGIINWYYGQRRVDKLAI